MSFVSVCDAWITDLTSTGRPLAGATVHKYAPWSMETLVNDGSRHVAIWPTASQPPPAPFATGNLPTDLTETSYAVVVWEDASSEAELRYDDDTANAAWLNLAAAIEARFRVQANTGLGGDLNAYTRLRGLTFALAGSTRVLTVEFVVRSTASFT